MGKFDAHKNFALSSIATAPSPATTGTSLVVTGGTGANFPAVPFNAVIWPTGAKPTSANAEIVRVTNIATDTFTIVRQQEGTSARTVIIGDQIMDASTAKVFQDIEALSGFRSLSDTDLDTVLPTSDDFVYDDVLEIGATVSFEVPATTTLEISAHLGSSDPESRNKILTDTFIGEVFDSSKSSRDIVLEVVQDYLSLEVLEVGPAGSIEVPVSTSLEIITYAPQVQGNPVGTLLAFAGSTAPAGYLLCQGQAVLRTAYPELFNVLGTAYGVGDGSTTFNIPDLRGRSPIGAGTGTATGATAQTLGAQPTTGAGGEQAHVQALGELAAHTHNVAARDTDDAGTTGAVRGTDAGVSFPTTSTGSSTAMNILSPVSVVNFIIKT